MRRRTAEQASARTHACLCLRSQPARRLPSRDQRAGRRQQRVTQQPFERPAPRPEFRWTRTRAPQQPARRWQCASWCWLLTSPVVPAAGGLARGAVPRTAGGCCPIPSAATASTPARARADRRVRGGRRGSAPAADEPAARGDGALLLGDHRAGAQGGLSAAPLPGPAGRPTRPWEESMRWDGGGARALRGPCQPPGGRMRLAPGAWGR